MLIKNVKIVNHDKTINNADILIEKGRIKEIIEKKGTAKYLAVPGFIDTHIHGFFNEDVMNGSQSCEIISRELAKNGVTSFMPTAMTNDWEIILKSLSEIAKTEKWVSKSLGIHIEGPFIGESKKGAHRKEWLKVATNELIDQMYYASETQLKKISFDPLNVPLEVMKHMIELGIIPSIGHSSADFQKSQLYFSNGCNSVCHLWNAMSGVDSRNPGMVQASLYNEKPYVELICDLKHIAAETLLFTIKNKGADKIICVSDAIKPAYYKDGDNISGGIPVTKNGLLITLKGTNTIAGSGISIHDAFRNLVSLGVPLQDVVKMTSYNSAIYLKRNDIGRIEEKKIADIVIMDKNTYDIQEVYISGKKVGEEI